MPQPDLITATEVARELHVDASTVRRWVAAKKLAPALVTPGGHFRFHRSDIDALLRPSLSA